MMKRTSLVAGLLMGLMALSESASVVVADIQSDLEAYYNFDEAQALESDASGQGRDLTVAGTVTGDQGIKNGGVNLDGFSSFRYDGTGGFDTLQDFTWSVWFNTDDDLQGALMSKSPEIWEEGAKALYLDDGILVFDIGFVGAMEFDGGLNDAQWHHAAVVVSYEGVDASAQLFVDGTEVAVMEEPLGEFSEPEGSQFKVAAGSTDFPEPSEYFGLLDEVRVYSRALSEEEIEELLLDGNPNPEPPQISQQPVGGTGVAGRSLTLSVRAEGLALRYQWFKDDTAIEGADGARLVLADMAAGDAGDYKVTVSNPGGEVTSETASVEVVDEWSPAIGLLGHWEFEESGDLGMDSSGNGVQLQNNGATQGTGFEGQALDLNRDGRLEDSNQELGFNTLQDFTWTAVVKAGEDGPILAKSPTEWSPGSKSLFIREGLLSFDTGWIGFVESEGIISDDQWHHVAITVDIEDEEDFVRLYIDGNPDGYWEADLEEQPDVGTFYIGYSSDDFPFEEEPANNYFAGQIDEVRVYNQAVAPEDIISIMVEDGGEIAPPVITQQPADLEVFVGQTARFTVQASGTGVRFQWLKDGEALEGATGRTLTLSGVDESDSGEYSVVVENELDTVTSEAAVLTVSPLGSGDNLAHQLEFLRSYWTFDEKEGDMIPDRVPESTHAGTLQDGADITQGDQGYGESGEALDPRAGGQQGHMAAGDPEGYDMNQSFTWSAWVKQMEPGQGEGNGIIGRAPAETDHNQGSKTLFVAETALAFDSGWVGQPVSDTDMNDGQWHHIAAVFDAQVDQLVLYLDGEAVIDEEFPATEFDETVEHLGGVADSGFRVGNGSNNFLSDSFPGLIDNVAIWETVLPPPDIALLVAGADPLEEGSVNGQPLVSVSRDGAEIVVEFIGLLQRADTVNGPWTDLTEATSPHTVDLSESEGYFRTVE